MANACSFEMHVGRLLTVPLPHDGSVPRENTGFHLADTLEVRMTKINGEAFRIARSCTLDGPEHSFHQCHISEPVGFDAF